MTGKPFTPSRHTERLTASFDGVRRAADLLRHGGVVAFGTETVYGLGALSASRQAVGRIFSVKGRPSFNPLISHVASAAQAFAEATEDFPLRALARTLAEKFWPGPLTLVLPRRATSRICDTASAGLPSIAVRVPRGRSVQDLLRLVDAPVAAPSANLSGGVSPSTAQHVLESLDGHIDAVLDTGPAGIGVESTVLDLSGERPHLLRPGGVTREELAEICSAMGSPLESTAPLMSGQTSRPLSPGQLSSHYAPSLPVRLNVSVPTSTEALLAFGPQTEEVSGRLVWNLSERGDVAEAAARLYAGLRFLDGEATRRGLTGIAVQAVPETGLGEALTDRLRRSAAPRS